MAGTQVIGDNTLEAVRSVMTCAPDYLVMGMSAVTFYGGAKGADAFQAKVEKEAGVRISIGSHSCTAALQAYGGVKRIAFLSPYYPVANEQVRKYFTDSGFQVVRDIYLECKSWTAIAEVPPDLLRGKLIELDGDDVDAIVRRHHPNSGGYARPRGVGGGPAGVGDQQRGRWGRTKGKKERGRGGGGGGGWLRPFKATGGPLRLGGALGGPGTTGSGGGGRHNRAGTGKGGGGN